MAKVLSINNVTEVILLPLSSRERFSINNLFQRFWWIIQLYSKLDEQVIHTSWAEYFQLVAEGRSGREMSLSNVLVLLIMQINR